VTGNVGRTVAAYDAHAETYADITRSGHAETREALGLFARHLGAGARVLEVASGPGWDADWLEQAGLIVRRTDLSEGFIAVQRARGRTVERLNLIEDDPGGPWDGIVALYVMQHVARDLTGAVVARLAGALRPGGLLLTSFQEGEGEEEQTGSEGGTYEVVRRSEDEVFAAVGQIGLEVVRLHVFQGTEARWMLVTARRP
jgi:2-polyprenyl-3-methyl-5-hydroxy-6-metoxy-1,4-benzoquinol methylase